MLTIDPDRPDTPAIASILSTLGMLCLLGSIACMLLTFSGYAWVNDVYALIGAGVAILIGVMMIGQAKSIELLALVSARVKSRFALEHAVMPAASAPSLMPTAERKPMPVVAQGERVISIPEEVARQQGVTRRREPI